MEEISEKHAIYFYQHGDAQNLFVYDALANIWFAHNHIQLPPDADRVIIEHYQAMWAHLMTHPEIKMPTIEMWRALYHDLAPTDAIQFWVDTSAIHQGDYQWLIEQTNIIPSEITLFTP